MKRIKNKYIFAILSALLVVLIIFGLCFSKNTYKKVNADETSNPFSDVIFNKNLTTGVAYNVEKDIVYKGVARDYLIYIDNTEYLPGVPLMNSGTLDETASGALVDYVSYQDGDYIYIKFTDFKNHTVSIKAINDTALLQSSSLPNTVLVYDGETKISDLSVANNTLLKDSDGYKNMDTEKSGYKFKGFSLTSDGELIDIDTYKVIDNVSLYLRYSKNKVNNKPKIVIGLAGGIIGICAIAILVNKVKSKKH